MALIWWLVAVITITSGLWYLIERLSRFFAEREACIREKREQQRKDKEEEKQ